MTDVRGPLEIATGFGFFYINDLRRRGLSTEHGLPAHIASDADDATGAAIRGACGFPIEFCDYDRSLNASATGAGLSQPHY